MTTTMTTAERGLSIALDAADDELDGICEAVEILRGRCHSGPAIDAHIYLVLAANEVAQRRRLILQEAMR